jgi:hypothetical protein
MRLLIAGEGFGAVAVFLAIRNLAGRRRDGVFLLDRLRLRNLLGSLRGRRDLENDRGRRRLRRRRGVSHERLQLLRSAAASAAGVVTGGKKAGEGHGDEKKPER